MLLKGPHSTASTEPKVGDIVLLTENLPRRRWKVGKICELIPSRDKIIRSAKVTVGQHKSFKRPLSLLYPIECPHENINNSDNFSEGNQAKNNEEMFDYSDYNEMQNEADDSLEDEIQQTVRPTRKAVIIAQQGIQEWLGPDEESSLGNVAAHAMR